MEGERPQLAPKVDAELEGESDGEVHRLGHGLTMGPAGTAWVTHTQQTETQESNKSGICPV